MYFAVGSKVTRGWAMADDICKDGIICITCPKVLQGDLQAPVNERQYLCPLLVNMGWALEPPPHTECCGSDTMWLPILDDKNLHQEKNVWRKVEISSWVIEKWKAENASGSSSPTLAKENRHESQQTHDLLIGEVEPFVEQWRFTGPHWESVKPSP